MEPLAHGVAYLRAKARYASADWDGTDRCRRNRHERFFDDDRELVLRQACRMRLRMPIEGETRELSVLQKECMRSLRTVAAQIRILARLPSCLATQRHPKGEKWRLPGTQISSATLRVSGRKRTPITNASPSRPAGYHRPASESPICTLINVTMKGDRPPIQPAARLCGRATAV